MELDLAMIVRDEEIDPDCDAIVDAHEGDEDKVELRDEALGKGMSYFVIWSCPKDNLPISKTLTMASDVEMKLIKPRVGESTDRVRWERSIEAGRCLCVLKEWFGRIGRAQMVSFALILGCFPERRRRPSGLKTLYLK